MEKIELTQLQKDLIQKQLTGEYSPFFATKEEQEAYNQVIDKAQELLDETEAYDEIQGDLVQWFWDKFQQQESGAEAAHTDVEQ